MSEKTEAKTRAKSASGEGAVPTPRLKTTYQEQIVPAMMESLGVSNQLEVPRILKIVVNMGVNEAKENIQALDSAREELGQITGQLPQVRRAKKSISNFKLREGMPIGLRVTLRGDRMYEFLDRLISTAIPRIRDFRGLEPNGFDGYGNFNLGLREQHIFPEVNVEKSLKLRGMNITVVTSAQRVDALQDKDAAALELMTRFGMPFKKRTAAGAKTERAPETANA